MALFSSEDNNNTETQNVPKDTQTLIGASASVDGNVVSSHSVVVEGTLKGEKCESQQSVHVEKDATVTANVNGKEVHIAGTVNGNVVAKEKLVVRASANIQGNITAATLEVEAGAQLTGQCTVTKNARPQTQPEKQ